MTDTIIMNTCGKCEGTGWIPTKGYKFYSQNGKLCSCGMFKTVNEAAQWAQEAREWAAAVENARYWADRKAAREARKAARGGS